MANTTVSKCDVCGKEVIITDYFLDNLLIESEGSCKHCGLYHYAFAYGHYIIVIDDQEFHSHYNDSNEEQTAIQEKMKKAVVKAIRKVGTK